MERGKSISTTREFFTLDNPRISAAIACTGELEDRSLSLLFPDWPGSFRNLPKWPSC